MARVDGRLRASEGRELVTADGLVAVEAITDDILAVANRQQI